VGNRILGSTPTALLTAENAEKAILGLRPEPRDAARISSAVSAVKRRPAVADKLRRYDLWGLSARSALSGAKGVTEEGMR